VLSFDGNVSGQAAQPEWKPAGKTKQSADTGKDRPGYQ
jgi:hypothetical protein